MTGDVLDDLIAPGLAVVFCGTQAGKASALRRAYYAKPGNRFWSALHTIGLTPDLVHPEEYARLLPLGIGLTDLAKQSSGQDADIRREQLDLERFFRSMRHHAPRIIAFTSKQAGCYALGIRDTGTLAYGRQACRIEGCEVHVLPSTSGLATSYWDLTPWHALARRIKETQQHAAA